VVKKGVEDMYPISIIEKRERRKIYPGIVFDGRGIVHLKEEQVVKKAGPFFGPIVINISLVCVMLVTTILLYAMPFMEMDARDRDTYLHLALVPTTIPNQQPLLEVLHALGTATSVTNFDSNISIVTVTGFQDTRSLLSAVETFEGVLAIQNSINGFQIKVVRGVL